MDLEGRHVVLIGMMGVGKTTVGRLLADRLGWAFWDNDEALERETGLTAAQVQVERGQPALHELEQQLLRRALARPEPIVLAAASSVVLTPSVLEGALTVWLHLSTRAEQQQIAASGQHHRPLPADAVAALERMSAERNPQYARIADVRVEVGSGPEATCERVLEALIAHDHPNRVMP
jgi:shikimate kinase